MGDSSWEKKFGYDRESNDGFTTLHPDRGDAGEIPCVSISHGLNADFSAVPETSYIRCRKCGFIMNKARHPKGWGTGISFDISANADQGWGGGPWGGGFPPSVADPVVLSGCPFCGTYIYD
jgi:hypothetical protein